MNDFLFLVAIENLKPTAQLPPGNRAWFSVVPESSRVAVVANVSAWFEIQPREVPFVVVRTLTALAFLILTGSFAWRALRIPAGTRDAREELDAWLRALFLTLAWFWLLCPTQNPWYWTWALPLLPFARGRAWLAVSGLALLYYLRFWLTYHWPDTSVLGTGYVGHVFFDFVATWIEFAPWLMWLTIEYLCVRKAGTAEDATTSKHRSQSRHSTELNTNRSALCESTNRLITSHERY